MTVTAVSADSHMDLTFLPPDTLISRVPAKSRDRAPRVVGRDGAKYWMSGDDDLGRYGCYGPGLTGGKREGDEGQVLQSDIRSWEMIARQGAARRAMYQCEA